MSRLRLIKGTTPTPPAANSFELFYSSSLTPNAAAIEDESGNVLRLGGFTTQDYRAIDVNYILAGTTVYVPRTGTRALFVECIGAGGAGGAVTSGSASTVSAGGGGGGGAYSAVWLTGAISAAYLCSVGAGGTGTGPDTTFGSGPSCTAKGGTVGATGSAAAAAQVGGRGGAGGASASGVGDIKFDGSAGYTGMCVATASGRSGAGGAGWGGLAGAPPRDGQGNGIAAAHYGAGGSGGTIVSGGASVTGGAGADGLIRIWEFA